MRRAAIPVRSPIIQAEKKALLFEKKKQKTFEFLNAPIGANETQETKVFWFFPSEKNETLLLYCDEEVPAVSIAAFLRRCRCAIEGGFQDDGNVPSASGSSLIGRAEILYVRPTVRA